jgi:hypothetical protein
VDGNPLWHQAVDYVHDAHLAAYVADARTRWAYVGVSDEPDAGPGGYHGAYTLPAHLDHPDAGQYRPPTPGSEAERLLLEALANPSEAEPPPPDLDFTPDPNAAARADEEG